MIKIKSQEEIDIVGSDEKNNYLFAECKWTNEKVDLNILEKLINKSSIFNCNEKYYYIFSKSGFTKGCIEKSNEMKNVILITYNDILSFN